LLQLLVLHICLQQEQPIPLTGIAHDTAARRPLSSAELPTAIKIK
jgi:hypothetical protein